MNHDGAALAAGAHNTIVTSRAGKDLVSCLVSGLLTIGPRFGGAIDDAARYFQARHGRQSPGWLGAGSSGLCRAHQRARELLRTVRWCAVLLNATDCLRC